MAAEDNIDIIVQEAFFSAEGGRPGVMIEVGAARPDYLSISQSFRGLGWKIVAIEPNPLFCAAHRSRGYDILEYACSDEDKDNVEFFVYDATGTQYRDGFVSYESFSSLGFEGQWEEHLNKNGNKERLSKIYVKVRRLDTLLAEFAPDVKEIDLIAVDTEGWELAVMRGIDLQKFRPKVVILENLFADKEYENLMIENQYVLWKVLYPNQIYVRSDLPLPKEV